MSAFLPARLSSLGSNTAPLLSRLRMQAWLQSSAFSWRRTNNFVWAQHGKFHDQLVADLGHAPWRRGWNLLAGLFAYVSNADYAFLFPGNAAAAAGTIRRQDSG